MKKNYRIEFKDPVEELPKKTGDYLCYINGEWIVLWYSSNHKLFNAYDQWPYWEAKKNSIHVTYWAELPEKI